MFDENYAPIAVTLPRAVQLTGLSRSGIYRLLTAGELRAVKAGARTLILWESLHSYMAALPQAEFGVK